MLVALTIERFVAVCHSAWARKNNSSGRAYIAVVFIPVVCLILYAPIMYTSSLTTCQLSPNQSIYQKRDNHLFKSSLCLNIYRYTLEIIFRAVPMCIIVTLNLFIIVKYRKLCNKRRGLTKKNNNLRYYAEEKRLIVLLAGISSMFVVFVTPVMVNFILIEESLHFSLPFQIYRACSNILEVSNYSMTFYMYFVFSREFRATFLELFSVRSSGEQNLEARTGGAVTATTSNRQNVDVKIVAITKPKSEENLCGLRI